MTLMAKRLQWGFLGVAAQTILSTPLLAADIRFGEISVKEINYLSTNLAGRSIGTEKEREAVNYLTQRLESFGYEPSQQAFTFERNGQTFNSVNIIAERKGTSGKQVIVGAHYDTAPSTAILDRSNLQGTNDNSSGVGVLLELAARLEPDTNNTVKFIFFGAEEVGLIGSEYYANNMSANEVKNTIGMINLDGLVVGDKMYFHAGRLAATKPSYGYLRDLALQIAQELDIPAETNPGLNPEYPKGTGCCSDLESFDYLVPVLAAEATNWDIGDLDGYTQTTNPNVPGGATWHDPATDNLEFINATFPGLIEERTQNYTQILDTLLDRLDSQPVPVPEPDSILGTTFAVGGLLTIRNLRKRKNKKTHL